MKKERLNESQESKKLGNELFKEDKYEEALEMYTKSLRRCPLSFSKDRAIFYSNRSVCFLKMKETEKCIKECTKSIELDSEFVKPLLRRAECYETTDKLDEALGDYKKLIDLEPRVMSHKQKCYVSCIRVHFKIQKTLVNPSFSRFSVTDYIIILLK